MEFELLDQSLFDFMEQRRNKPLPMKELRPVVRQVGLLSLLAAEVPLFT